MEEVPRRTSPVPPCVPLFVHCLIRVETEGLLDYQGQAGIISIVRWNLRPVIFGVKNNFLCIIQSAGKEISCLQTLLTEGVAVHDPRVSQKNSMKGSSGLIFRSLESRHEKVSKISCLQPSADFSPDLVSWCGRPFRLSGAIGLNGQRDSSSLWGGGGSQSSLPSAASMEGLEGKIQRRMS